jgi:hypothetical protein
MDKIVIFSNDTVIAEFQMNVSTELKDYICFSVLYALPLLGVLSSMPDKDSVISMTMNGNIIPTGFETKDGLFRPKVWYGDIVTETINDFQREFRNYRSRNEAAKSTLHQSSKTLSICKSVYPHPAIIMTLTCVITTVMAIVL